MRVTGSYTRILTLVPHLAIKLGKFVFGGPKMFCPELHGFLEFEKKNSTISMDCEGIMIC